MNTDKPTADAELESLQRDTFKYFLLWTNPQNGLVRDKTAPDWPASIAATGLALASYPVAVERGLGVPDKLASYHTAVVGNYWVEGHVPADLVQKLLQEQPANIKGISAPGMPQSAPGMETPNPMPYSVYSVDKSG